MPRGPRKGTTSARRVQRKAEKTLLATHGGYGGASLIEQLETELLEAMISYLRIKDERAEDQDEEHTLPEWVDVARKEGLKLGKARGLVGGLVKAVAIMRNAYTADDPQVIKAIEREFIRYARAELSTATLHT